MGWNPWPNQEVVAPEDEAHQLFQPVLPDPEPEPVP